jgi:transposase
MNIIDLSSQPPPNLSGMELESDVKRRLVDETHERDSSYNQVMEKYKIKYYTLRKYFKRVNNGLPIYKSGGRPGKIDELSQEKIVEYMNENRNFDKLFIHKLIREETKETLHRRYPMGIPVNVRQKISKLCVREWTKTLISRHNQWIDRHAVNDNSFASNCVIC